MIDKIVLNGYIFFLVTIYTQMYVICMKVPLTGLLFLTHPLLPSAEHERQNSQGIPVLL